MNLKGKKNKDLVIVQLDKNSKTAGVFTSSKTVSESIKWSKKNIKNNIKLIVINSGNANALTGKKGYLSIKNYTNNIAKTLNYNLHIIKTSC